MKKMFLVLGLLLVSSQSFATGGLSCRGENTKVKLNIDATTGGRLGTDILNLTGKVEYKESTLAQDMRVMEFDETNVVGSWLIDNEVKLGLVADDAVEHFGVELKIILNGKTSKKGITKATAKIEKSINTVNGDSTQRNNSVKVVCTQE